MASSPAPEPGAGALVARLRRAAPALVVLLILGAASFAPANGETDLRLASPDRSHVDAMRSAIADLPGGALVLVGLDADFGTYPEIRATVRSALSDLLGHGAQLGFVSFTPEGRAIAAAELDRLAREGGISAGAAPADLGFVAGSEAGLVRGVESIVPAGATGPIPDAIRTGGGGIGAFSLVLIVSGSDLSARSWVEQVRPRVPDLPMVAIAPSFLDPELEPYLRSGQLTALLSTLREGAAYVQVVGAGTTPSGAPPRPLPILLGMLIALGVIAEAAFRQLAGRSGGRGFRRTSA